MAKNLDLNKLMNEKGYYSFEYYTPCPVGDKVKQYGNFKIVRRGQQYGMKEIYIRYVGNNDKFQFLNMPSNKNSTWAYRYLGATAKINDENYSLIYRSYNAPSKNNTISQLMIIKGIEEVKRFKDNIEDRKQVHKMFSTDIEIKNFKKAVKLDRLRWEQTKKEVVETAYKISYDEFLKNQEMLLDVESTNFVLKVAPMLTRLRDECDLILQKLNDPEGPSTQAKEDFLSAYRKFGNYHNRKTILYAIKTFKNKKKPKGRKPK